MSDHDRAMKRLHAVAATYGITHDMLSEWADDAHRCGSLREVATVDLDALALQIDRDGEDYAEVFRDLYGPRSIVEFAQIAEVPS